jgi:hypothetical protein
MTAMLVWNALCSTSMPENLKWRNRWLRTLVDAKPILRYARAARI